MFYSTLNGKQLIKFRNPFFHNRLAPPTRPMLPVRPQPALCPPHPSASAAVFPNRQSVLRRCANRHRPFSRRASHRFVPSTPRPGRSAMCHRPACLWRSLRQSVAPPPSAIVSTRARWLSPPQHPSWSTDKERPDAATAPTGLSFDACRTSCPTHGRLAWRAHAR
jgi:hypothetical protein